MAIGLNSDTDSVSVSDELIATVGTIITSSRQTPPTGYLGCDGSTASRTIYSRLFNVIVPSRGTVTITIASPGVVTLNSHGFLTGESVFLTTTGALPTGLFANTLYFVVENNANSFWLAADYNSAIANTRITTSGSQSGTHTLFYCPYGLGDGSSTFTLPNLKNATIRGRGLNTGFTQIGTTRLGFLENDSFQSHRHSHNYQSLNVWLGSGGANINFGGTYSAAFDQIQVQSPTTDGPNGTPRTDAETRMKNQGVNFFIKF